MVLQPLPLLQLSAEVLHINANQTYKPLSSSWGWDQTLQEGKTDQRFQQCCFFRPNPVHTLKSPMTCLFCWDFENNCKVFWCRPKDRKIEGCQSNFASSLVCWINCKNPCWCIPSLNVLSRLWKSINWVMFSSIWTISTIWYCIIVQHHPMQYHIRAHMMKCWDATLKSCNTTYHKITWYCIISESLLWYIRTLGPARRNWGLDGSVRRGASQLSSSMLCCVYIDLEI